MPSHLLEPLLNVLKILQQDYGVSFVFSTATQPAFRQSNAIKNGFAENEITEITQDTETTFAKLQRVNFHFAKPGSTESWASIAGKMTAQNQALCIVNTRRHARELYEELTQQADDRKAVFHLSSLMCAQHRFDILENQIRVRLKANQACHVVSTQLIEAGVDIDFPVVYRALAPLDSIVQAAGRCNREGKLARGEVYLFNPEQNTLPRGFYATAQLTSRRCCCNKSRKNNLLPITKFSLVISLSFINSLKPMRSKFSNCAANSNSAAPPVKPKSLRTIRGL